METIAVALFFLLADVVSGAFARMSPVPLPLPLVQIALGSIITSVANLGVAPDQGGWRNARARRFGPPGDDPARNACESDRHRRRIYRNISPTGRFHLEASRQVSSSQVRCHQQSRLVRSQASAILNLIRPSDGCTSNAFLY